MAKACDLCQDQLAAVLCSECHRCYCNECSQFVHRSAKNRGHKTDKLLENVTVDAMCPIHKGNPLEMFCLDEVKLCCAMCKVKEMHKGHNLIYLSDILKDNEVFSASDVRKRFAAVTKCNDDLDKKIEAIVEVISKEAGKTKEKVVCTFRAEHKKLEEEEAKIMEELERICNESIDALQKNLNILREACEYSKVLSEANTRIQEGRECNRLMELNLVCEMEKQLRTMEKLHKCRLSGLHMAWNSETRELTFAQNLFNGVPVPYNIEFPSVLGKSLDISWSCDGDDLSEEDKASSKYVVEMKKKFGEEWKEVYSGKEKSCTVVGLERMTEYSFRVRCDVGDLCGGWSIVVSTRTDKTDSSILSQEENKEVFSECLNKWCGSRDFELLYRGSRDGFGASDFHRSCDNQGSTLVLVKNGCGHVFGGFSSESWASSNSLKQAPGSFLFTLTNIYGTQPTKFPLYDENDHTVIYDKEHHGPIFGNNGDLVISSGCNKNSKSNVTFSAYNEVTEKGFQHFFKQAR